MMADETITIITQKEGERFALDHNGVALYGDREQPAMQHEVAGQIIHSTLKPLVHMVCWDEENPCKVEVSGNLALAGNVTLSGDKERPLEVHMAHTFANEHQQTMAIKPFDHTMKVATQLAEPIHHALQMRTPLQLRFCNPWQVDSDYRVEVMMGKTPLFSIQLRGATILTPQPCEDEKPKPPIKVYPGTI
jgi:hypothetical protein